MKKYLSSGLKNAVLLILLLPSVAQAAAPTLVSGTLNLLNDATTWLLGLVPAGTALMAGWNLWVKSMNEGDPAEAAAHGKAAKKVVISGIIITGVVGLVKALLAYYS